MQGVFSYLDDKEQFTLKVIRILMNQWRTLFEPPEAAPNLSAPY